MILQNKKLKNYNYKYNQKKKHSAITFTAFSSSSAIGIPNWYFKEAIITINPKIEV